MGKKKGQMEKTIYNLFVKGKKRKRKYQFVGKERKEKRKEKPETQ